jgi:serine/threonine protein kinase
LLDIDGHFKIVPKIEVKQVEGSQLVQPSYEYVAPEIIEGQPNITSAVDWWSIGVFTFQFLTGNVI